MTVLSATPAGRGEKGSALPASTYRAYDDPTPSPSWSHRYYICACGFEVLLTDPEDAFRFKRVPHPCRLWGKK